MYCAMNFGNCPFKKCFGEPDYAAPLWVRDYP
jgi:hypothetical protein